MGCNGARETEKLAKKTPPHALHWPELVARLDRQQGHSKPTKDALC